MINRKIRIGTRGSALALWQANYFKDQVQAKDVDCQIVIIKTQGDQVQNLSFDKMEGKGFFTKEIEDALLNEEVDVAVHSMKDLPTDHPKGLVIGGISERANPQDLLIIHPDSYDADSILKIRKNSAVGTSSIRRKILLRSFQDDLKFIDIRGNVPTRVKKLESMSELDAIVLAAAGIERLKIDLVQFEVVRLNAKEFPSAPAQGVLAYQCRENDLEIRRLLNALNSAETLQCTNVERQILKLMQGGCQLPLGAYCEKDVAGNYHCYAAYAKDNFDPVKFANLSQTTTSNLAERMVEKLKSKE